MGKAKFCLALTLSLMVLSMGGWAPVPEQASISLSPNKGGVGDRVTIEGAGFGSNTYVIVTYDTQVIITCPTDELGEFRCCFLVPESPFGEHIVEVTDGIEVGRDKFCIDTPKIVLPDMVPSGVPFIIAGTGFNSKSVVTLAFEPQVGVSAAATAGCNGSFRVAVSVSVEARVEVRVVATDEQDREGNATFALVPETVPPPSPPPPSPSPPSPVTVTPPAPAPVFIPTPVPPVLLWTIVGIGAALIIAVIILIVKTRRVV